MSPAPRVVGTHCGAGSCGDLALGTRWDLALGTRWNLALGTWWDLASGTRWEPAGWRATGLKQACAHPSKTLDVCARALSVGGRQQHPHSRQLPDRLLPVKGSRYLGIFRSWWCF